MAKNVLAKQQAELKKKAEALYEQGQFDGFGGGVQAGFHFWFKVINETKGIGPVMMDRIVDKAAEMAKMEVEAGTAVGVGIKYMKRLQTIEEMFEASKQPAETKTGEETTT